MNLYTPGKSIAMCSDHAGYNLKEIIKRHLEEADMTVQDFGTYSDASCDYPDFAHPAAEAVEKGECYPGIAMCGTGNGIAMTLNKHQGIRGTWIWRALHASTTMPIYLCCLHVLLMLKRHLPLWMCS